MTVNTTQHASNYNDFTGLANLRTQAQHDQKAALDETAQQFEALFIQMMLAEMRKSIPKDGMFDSQAVQTYQDMADKQVSLDMSKRGDFGIANVIKAQFERQGMAMPAEQLLKLRSANQSFDVQSLISGMPLAGSMNTALELPVFRQPAFNIERQDPAAMLLNAK
ncbi:rod-binding protein [Candidatus Njordibacter sp. Uisw_039]|jgi:flagellar protein FlgJ|uniref:rod-binding protein n=1 Tax=Candidatus Njordibacter sp. Uisw_039 TaxID=3230972 RepID=UPI003D533D7C|tara:strand:- start:1187 stop:1681 length:495 start_codon:yes stop_codon:yes gene_type:complete